MRAYVDEEGSPMSHDPASQKQEETSIPETLQSLIVAFALAMSVRSFVTEGFVIPTGSMAPTLMGQHARIESPATGYDFPIDVQPAYDPSEANAARDLYDPMLSTSEPLQRVTSAALRNQTRTGDRVLVLKYLYAVQEPKRWDVVVFKNPTDPHGDTANFIKRLVGLPNEQLLMVDGDVFTAPLDGDRSQFRVARKPEYIQRAVWQQVYDSDFQPVDPMALAKAWGRPWQGPPWRERGFRFGEKDNARVWRHDGDGEASLEWMWERMPITDWGSYNMLRIQPVARRYPVSDLRFSAALAAEKPDALSAEYTLTTRRRAMRFMLGGGNATLRIEGQPEGSTEAPRVLAEKSVPFATPAAGAPFAIECWHVDQRLSLFVNGREIVHLDDTFESLEDRVRASFYGRTVEDYTAQPTLQMPTPPQLAFRARGTPLSLTRVRVDRDLYYRPEILNTNPLAQLPQNGPPITGFAFGSDLERPARLEADQFMMCGDNSAFSRDSRLWGRPSLLVTELFGEDAPFLVPRPLLLGKAWCVYFPAPVPPIDAAPALMPDFGELRFIR
jgi:signal peptidase I